MLRSSAIQESATSPTDAIVPDNLNVYKKGLFRKNVSPSELLSWSKEPISQPLLVTPERQLRKAKRTIFKLIQIYMGDRKAKHGMTLSSVAHEIVLQGYRVEALRDELFLHICKQTTDNPRRLDLAITKECFYKKQVHDLKKIMIDVVLGRALGEDGN